MFEEIILKIKTESPKTMQHTVRGEEKIRINVGMNYSVYDSVENILKEKQRCSTFFSRINAKLKIIIVLFT